MVNPNVETWNPAVKHYSRVRAAVFNTPWLIDELKLEAIAEIVESASYGLASRDVMPDTPFEFTVQDGVAIIPIEGVISPKMNLFSRISGGTSIEVLDRQFEEAMADMDVHTVLLRIDSPGGNAQGVPELGRKIRESAQTSNKVIISLCEGMMTSAAYWLGSQADEVYATESSEVGGIGVVVQLFDRTRALKNDGIDPVTIKSSELKAVGRGPLTDRQSRSIEQRVMVLFDMFKAAVSEARPQLDFQALGDPGDTRFGIEAAEIGLTDGITTFDKLMARLSV